MPIFLVDIGNTNIKCGLADGAGIGATFALPTDHAATADSLGLALTAALAFAGHAPSTVDMVAVSSVVPPLNPVLAQAAERFLGQAPRFVPDDLPVPLQNRYARPHEVGADRLVTAYAGRLASKAEAVIVVDFGTATTFDCVKGDAFLGGLICPGLLTSLSALASRTAKLPHVALTVGDGTLSIGTSTAECINQGFVFGFAAMVEGIVARLTAHLGGAADVLATGGFAEKLAPLTPAIAAVRPELLLEGLRRLAIG